jgi:hypothetical protein
MERFFGSVARKRLNSEREIKEIGKNGVGKIEGGGYPIPGILQSVRKWLIAEEFDGHSVSKCEESVRKEKEVKGLNEATEVQEAAWAASRRG